MWNWNKEQSQCDSNIRYNIKFCFYNLHGIKIKAPWLKQEKVKISLKYLPSHPTRSNSKYAFGKSKLFIFKLLKFKENLR